MPPLPLPGDATSSSRNRTYYPGDLRRDLLDAALAAAVETGPTHVSLRDLARRLGVSHAAPKNHFADKQTLFTVLATEAHQRLASAIDDAVARAGNGDPVRRLIEAGRAYLRFAQENPGYFTVMWQEDIQNRADPALLDASGRTFGSLLTLAGHVTAPGQDGVLNGQDSVRVATLAWAVVHGLADLAAGGALDDVPGLEDPAHRHEELLNLVETLLGGRHPGNS